MFCVCCEIKGLVCYALLYMDLVMKLWNWCCN